MTHRPIRMTDLQLATILGAAQQIDSFTLQIRSAARTADYPAIEHHLFAIERFTDIIERTMDPGPANHVNRD